MYQLVRNKNGNVYDDVILRNDGAFIPCIASNTDYQAYLKWLADGNEPLPADEPSEG